MSLVAEGEHAWTFLAEGQCKGEIRVVAVDPLTLLSTIVSVEVEIED